MAAKRERLHAWVKEMAPEQYARMRFPERRHYSFYAFEALEFAYDCGRDFDFTMALYDLMWTEGRDIGDRDLLTVETSRGAEQTISTAKYEVTGRGGKGRELLQRGQFIRVVPPVPELPAIEGNS